MERKIIPAKPEHLEAAAEIAVAAWTPIREIFRRELGDDIYEGFFNDWQAEKRRAVTQELTGGHGYVVLLEGRVAGFISFRVDGGGRTATIGTNAVAADCRGLGLGPYMYKFVQEELRRMGVEFVKVTTGGDEGHAPARRAYQKTGFENFLPSVCYYKKL